MQFQPTVFLIDDDTDDQEIFGHALERANGSVKCVFADDGILALEKIRNDESFNPDFIFIDMNMPRMNGQQCLAEIKKIDRLKHIPVYMYSTASDPESLEENKRLGAKDFIVKPSNVQDLISILKEIIHKPVFTMLLMLFSFSIIPEKGIAQDTLSTVRELKRLSVEELMNIVVTSVSKSPQNLSEVASAIQVLTGNDIRRSAALRLPDALRLAPNLQVTQSGSHDWGISARGFNGAPVANSSLADKLLVMIDGRTVYTPLFGGVFWDVQNVLLVDINRIEVISGPGGTLWGSNAVNGIVNIISKEASETQGLYGSVNYGSLLRDHVAARYGFQIDSALYIRVYGQRYDYENSLTADSKDALDAWNFTQGGFRMDYKPSASRTITLQSELYAGEEDDTLRTITNGQHLLSKWTQRISDKSEFVLQAYFDRTWRDIGTSGFNDELTTFDVEAQQSFSLGDRNHFLAGIGYRFQYDKTSSPDTTFTPATKDLKLYSAFIQDQIELVPDRLTLTIGSKFLHNDYTGFEIQPSGRLAWTISDIHTLWGAVSRTVRIPSRFDIDFTAFQQVEHPKFLSEKVIAYELGYRLRPLEKASFSIATFYNQYSDLRTLSYAGDPTMLYFGNDMEANTLGLEVSGNLLISNWWRVRGGYTYLSKDFTITASNVLEGTEFVEGIDPSHQLLIHSIMDISKSLQVDLITRYVDDLPAAEITNTEAIPAYVELNMRIAWEYKFMTISFTGQNLLNESHQEFGRRRIPRSINANIAVRW